MSFPYRAIVTLAVVLSTALALPLAFAEDIDIFVGRSSDASASRPNLLIVLDNTSNWARHSQQWPGGLQQGQSEVRAIRNALAGLEGRVNVGLMEYVTEGDANDNGGYIRHALKPLDAATREILNGKLVAIDVGINDPVEKRNANEEYGFLMHDVYEYLNGGFAAHDGAGTPASLADADGYQTAYSRFESPLTELDLCADTYMVFISNPNSNGPAEDESGNSDILRGLIEDAGGTADQLAEDSSGTPIPIPKFNIKLNTEVAELPLGLSAACYNNVLTCTKKIVDTELCSGMSSCVCGNPSSTSDCEKRGQERYTVTGQVTTDTTTVEETGTFDTTKGRDWNFDDWAKFLFAYGIPVGAGDDRIRVVTYTIDVFNKQQNADHTGLMLSAARVGGGRYFAARNQEALEDALEQILSEILSVNSTFASSALPISATNRSQNENQVFIGMFRPDKQAKPGWFGNLKRYQLAFFNGELDLADSQSPPIRAVNLQTGFVSECAKSFWSSDSVDYWAGRGVQPDPKSECVGNPNPYSDAPDGPFVEKGAVGQGLRGSSPGDRNLLDAATFSTLEQGTLDGNLFDYILGWEATESAARDTIHGDVVHSRPLAVNYGGEGGVVVYYGANDGIFRAVDAETGAERWSAIAPEYLANSGERFLRLKDGTPLIEYPDMLTDADVAKKDYFFDGLIGQVLRYDEDNQISQAWIYPSMRRGGRMLYALDVTDPDKPELLWRRGCPNLHNDTGCDSEFAAIGQTWSFPNTAYIAGYESGAKAVVVMGGGYDNCEDLADANLPNASDCGDSTKGRGVYVIDAEDGTLIEYFPTDRAVAADVALVDLDFDGKADYAYAADTGGSLYRIAFPPSETEGESSDEEWTITKIAYTSGGYRKFLNGPAVMPYRGAVYLALGSGNRERPLETNYPYVHEVQDRFYVFLDTPRDGISGSPYPFNLDGEHLSDLTEPTDCDEPRLVLGGDKKGWFMDLPNRGEQTVTTAVIIGGMATFSTSRPGGTAVGGVCSQPLGIAEGYWVDLFNASGAIGVTGTCGGQRSAEFVGGGIPPSPVTANVRIGDVPTTVVIGAIPRDGRLGTPISPQEIDPAIHENRSRVYRSVEMDR
jgi:type IV pilus assembly protein PilY1